MSFRVGQKVVCVDDAVSFGYGDESYPKRGEIYTIREFKPYLSKRGDALVLLVEIQNDERFYTADNKPVFTEKSFGIYRFRPLVTRKTSIEVFTAMLTPSKQGVDA